MSFLRRLRDLLRKDNRLDASRESLREADVALNQQHGGASEGAGPPPPESQPIEIPPSENPFGILLLDVAPVTGGLTAFTTDKRIAEHFAGRTASDFVDEEIPGATRIPCALEYPFTDPALPPPGCIHFAREMEDKWDISFHGGALHFRRSWTGQLVYRMPIRLDPDRKIRATELQVDPGEIERFGTTYAVRAADFLIKALMYRRVVPAPLPESIRADAPRRQALWSFSVHGRAARFVTFEETLGK